MSFSLSSASPSAPFGSTSQQSAPPTPAPNTLQAQRQQVLDKAGLVAANNELLLQAIISRQLNALAGQAFVEPRYLDTFSRAIDIKPGLHHMNGYPPPPPPSAGK